MKRLFKILKYCFFIFIGFFIILNLMGFLYALVTPKIDIGNANAINIYDSNKTLIFQGSENSNWVKLEDISDYVIEATLSVEDKNFYKHNGFDYLRIFKALLADIKAHSIVQGASTISQQYAKNLFLDFDKSWKRKWKEMWLTYDLEYHYTKDQILEGYLNSINYGNGIYGISNASKYYFNKDVGELSLSEASILAGIPNSPSNYSLIDNFDNSKERQLVVLNRMYKNKYIEKDDIKKIYNEELIISANSSSENNSTFLYYKDAVMNELFNIESIPKSYLESGSLKIYTFFDKNAQQILESETNNNLSNDTMQSAKIMMNPNNGEIIALTGGINYNKSQYNRALNSLRQPGSAIKPFLYYLALENGFTASSTFLSELTTFNFGNGNSYKVKNSGNIYANKDISMAAAIAYSDNIYAVKTNIFLGEELLYKKLKELGITSNISATPSLALGAYEFNMIELTSIYATLANGGNLVSPHFILKVEDLEGNVLYKYKENKKNALDSDITYIISELLTNTYDTNLIDYTYPTCINMISSLTNKYAIKSGSTDTDAWVIGYNKDIVLTSWVGYDDNKNIENNMVSDNKNAWVNIIERYFSDKDTSWYDIPKNVVGVLVDPINGQVATNLSKNKKILYYLKGTEPSL